MKNQKEQKNQPKPERCSKYCFALNKPKQDPGHSSITYEFWKSWKEPKKNSEGNDDKKPISISLIHQNVFNDIKRHRIEDKAYTKGIMSLIFKKKGKKKIETNRPITC